VKTFRIKEQAIPNAHAQVWVLIRDLGDGRISAHRVEDDASVYATMPAEWMEPVAPPIPAEPEPGAYLIGDVLAVRVHATQDKYAWAIHITVGQNRDIADVDWANWADVWETHGGPGVTIRRLVPEPSTVDTPDDGPIPFPGEAVAWRLPGGGWVEARSATKVPTPEYDGPQCGRVSPEGGWYCTGHLAGWHVASTGPEGRVGAVWPIKAGAR